MDKYLRIVGVIAVALLAIAATRWTASAADHGDTPLLTSLGRSDAKLTDLHVFTRGDNLVLALSTNTAVPTSATTYTFSPDVDFRILIDHDSAVSFDDANANAVYGGTVVNPAGISADVEIKIHANPNGKAVVDVDGIPNRYKHEVRLFAGLRDDPFIRGPREGRNVGSMVIQLPLAAVVDDQPTLLVWAVSKVDGVNGPFQDLAGRALRSMFSENDLMNSTPPSMHTALMGVPPDVIIFDTSRPAAFPNGRDLPDDVVDLVGDPRVTLDDAPFPSANDRPFLDSFPYLATPHPPY